MTNDDLCPHCHLPRQGAHSCMHSMQAEIERLRQALGDVLKETYASQELTEKLHGIAGAALGHEPKPPQMIMTEGHQPGCNCYLCAQTRESLRVNPVTSGPHALTGHTKPTLPQSEVERWRIFGQAVIDEESGCVGGEGPSMGLVWKAQELLGQRRALEPSVSPCGDTKDTDGYIAGYSD